jgi:hypothetical protein
MPETPRLDDSREDWTPRLIAVSVSVPERTVRRWCRNRFPDWSGDWRLNHEQAQQVVNRMFTYGYKKHLAVK